MTEDCEVLNAIRLSDVQKLVIETLTKLSVPTDGMEFSIVMRLVIDMAQPNKPNSKKSRVDYHSLLYVENEVLALLQNLTVDDVRPK